MEKYKIEIKWAFIFAAMFLLWIVMKKLAGMHDEHSDKQQLVTMLVLIPIIGGLVTGVVFSTIISIFTKSKAITNEQAKQN